jgi:hypothetical protein
MGQTSVAERTAWHDDALLGISTLQAFLCPMQHVVTRWWVRGGSLDHTAGLNLSMLRLGGS